MSGFRSLYKVSIFSYLIDPLFYASSLITIFFAAFKFFFVSKFFVLDIGSTDLRPFFNSIPYVSIITIPLLTLRLRPYILNDYIPVSSFKRFLSLTLAEFTVFCIPLILLISLPVCVSKFGNIEILQSFTGFSGIFFYGFTAISLSILFFTIFPSHTALPLIFASFTLAIVNFIHLLPLYIKTGNLLTFISHKLSFAWHFDSFSKGILDSRNLFYYIVVSFILILLSTFFEYKRLGKTVSTKNISIISLSILFFSLSVSNLYFRVDLTKNKQFSVSSLSKEILSSLDEELRITYFRSDELKNLYPQTGDIAEFLSSYALSGKNISLNIEKPDEKRLKTLGIQSQQIRHENGTKTEYVSVYSAIVLQYLDSTSVLPFVLSAQSLEYDLNQRLVSLVNGKERHVYLLCGNGKDLQTSYSYVSPWLNSRGFIIEELNDFNSTEVLKNLTADDEIAVFGTKNLSFEKASLLQNALDKGTKAFIATSPFYTNIEDEWKISKPESDFMISYLNGKGFAFTDELIEDISCYPITMTSGEGNQAEYVTVNYPLWPVLQNQENAKQGLTLFWASPLYLYNDVKPLLFTSTLAWTQKSSGKNGDDLFLTNPFTLPKTASQSDATPSQFVAGARAKNISLVSDQFFVSSLLTGLISGESGGDFRNYDYLTKELLILRDEEELASLMEKVPPATGLYKIPDETEFFKMRKITIGIIFVLLPLLISALFIVVIFFRKLYVSSIENHSF